MFGAPVTPMLCSMDGLAATIELTPAQRQFVQDHDAVSVMRAETSPVHVFVYAHEPLRMHRWLIDASGVILDLASFRNTPK
jgi:hypothetical protein